MGIGARQVVEELNPDAGELRLPGASRLALTLRDLVEGMRRHHLWLLLGWQDIQRRYRRSVLGPFWETISMGMLVGALGYLYGALFQFDSAAFVPFLALGFLIWTLLAGAVNDGCRVFIDAESIITQTRLPFSVHVYRLVWRHVLIFFHNALVFVAVALVFNVRPGWISLLSLPGVLLLCVNIVWAVFLLGIISARFRDVPPIVASVIRIAFFLTPIIWMPDLVPERAVVLEFNIFHHLIELIRAPLLGEVPALSSWVWVLCVSVVGWILALAFMRQFRWRIPYWA